MRSAIARLAVPAVVAAGLLAGCGGSSGGGGTDPATVAPADAGAYVELQARPEGKLAESVGRVASSFLDVHSANGLRKLIGEMLIEKSDSSDLGYSRDVEPALGDRVAVFFGSLREDAGGDLTDAALISEVRDPSRARKLVDKVIAAGDQRASAKHTGGVPYRLVGDTAVGFVDGMFVSGDEPGFRSAVAASKGRSLADSKRLTDAREESSGALALAVVDTRTAAAEIARSANIPPDALRAFREAGPSTLAVGVDHDTVTVDTAGGLAISGGDAALLRDLPGDALAALTTSGFESPVGKLLRAGFEAGITESAGPGGRSSVESAFGVGIDEAFASLGSVGAFLEIDGLVPSGAIVAQVRDRAKAAKVVRAAATIMRQQEGAKVSARPGGRGFRLRVPNLPVPVTVALEGDRLVIGADTSGGESAVTEAIRPDSTLGSGGAVRDARTTLGSGFEPTGFVDVKRISSLLSPLLALSGSGGSVGRYLDKIDSVAVGTRSRGGRDLTRIAIKVG